MRKLVFIVGCFTLLLACSQKSSETPTQPIEAPKVTSSLAFTTKEWKQSFAATFEETKRKTDDDGVTSYGACFEKGADDKCTLFASGKRDAFRKLDHLIPLHTFISRSLKLDTYVGVYVAAVECKAPSLLVAPSVNEKGNWLFLEKAAFMADGEVVLEHNFDYDQVDRQNASAWVHEDGTFVASDADILALEKFVSAQKHAIRLTGKKGYTTVAKDAVANFVADAKAALEIRKRLNAGLLKDGGPVCTKAEGLTSNN